MLSNVFIKCLMLCATKCEVPLKEGLTKWRESASDEDDKCGAIINLIQPGTGLVVVPMSILSKR